MILGLKHKKKAGVFIYGYHSGDTEHARMAVVAPYSEGRFGASDKAYVLAKGSIDGDEHPIVAALREACEETGIDLAHMLGPENIARLMRGEAVANITHPDFPGVTIRRFSPHPAKHLYQFQGYRPSDVSMYGVELDGIEHLKPKLKNQKNGNGLGHVGVTVAQRTRMEDGYPSFAELLDWMEKGHMPTDCAWSKGVPLRLPDMAGKPHAEWFAQLSRKHGLSAKTPEAFRVFSDRVQRYGGADEYHFRHAIKTMKEALEKLGVTKGDGGDIKLDEKDSPLCFYQEGADLMYADEYLALCIERMRANPQYAMSFGGAKAKQSMRPRDYISHSQLIACAPFLKPEDIARAEQRVQHGVGADGQVLVGINPSTGMPYVPQGMNGEWRPRDINPGKKPEKLDVASEFARVAERHEKTAGR